MNWFLVMDRFDSWDQAKAAEDYGHDFPRWWQRDIVDTVERNRHHACIVCWSIGNEVPVSARKKRGTL